MSYVSGFLQAVPNANKAAYKAMAEKGWAIFKDYGCLSLRENWGVDVADGKVTSFPMAVKKKEDETVVFSWMEWPDKETCDKAWEAMMKDPRMAEMGEMPFDGMRMMWGGFEPLVTLDRSA
ncbi:DUF1428 domain-containing protein [Pikeienuella piscinae]|uniref:DUF1428 domain-containing protein n=1 Tax=Pikeienuella piscinae TaxID=2748098 RepID=A0A7M3T5Q6_9RHOB|nr:DUF1428 domain-containing protein [Pikeienuella piscinae]QIE57337.1 DUF1428 domain-containing protein [Pikeienuella piscinae]